MSLTTAKTKSVKKCLFTEGLVHFFLITIPISNGRLRHFHCVELPVNTKQGLNGLSKNNNLHGKDSYPRFLIIVYMKESKITALCFLLRLRTSRDVCHWFTQNFKLTRFTDSFCHMDLSGTALLNFIIFCICQRWATKGLEK